MGVILGILLYGIMMTLTAALCYYMDATSANGVKFGGTKWADDFVGFHMLAGAFWPLALPVYAICYVAKRLARSFLK